MMPNRFRSVKLRAFDQRPEIGFTSFVCRSTQLNIALPAR